MSEKLLKALMQLFAIIANVDDVTNKSRSVVEQFLRQRLNQEQVEQYLSHYDEFLEAHHKISKRKEGARKKTSLNSVKVLRICTQINSELAQKQKVFVLIRVLEYIHLDKEATDQELEFAETVGDVFNISLEERESISNFITANESTVPNSDKIIIINDAEKLAGNLKNKHIQSEGMKGMLALQSIDSVNMIALRYLGASDLFLNGQILDSRRTYILTQGSSIRSSKVNPIYYSDIISKFLSDKTESQIVFNVDDITYKFKGGKLGLNPLTFSEKSGKLIGIMGASGSGKSTLLNLLNGNYTPTTGSVTINGIDIHHGDAEKTNGLIGYISQDDLLIEELTVFQNLFYNAKLCFDGHSDEQISKVVLELLNSLGLLETKDLEVGSPLDKKISGGQRKRLNIALELIREPSVLFVDEPTSGLSSRDSENIMDLLKELALKGKLVFVVIHQPSSEIFKMFDKLLIMDTGGFPIYYGNPLDAVIYYKTEARQINNDVSECIECGNVNPEQIFNIIEAKVVDEYGNLTENRKVSPKEWYDVFLGKKSSSQELIKEKPPIPKITFKTPNMAKQFKVFITRDVLSKVTNKQYLLINLLEAPVLAFILAYFLRFYQTSKSSTGEYVFYENDNLIAYMFMSVIVALFIGLTVSAEEIFKDRKIRKRESFLNLSKLSYVSSKITIMFVLSAIQTFSFIFVGNMILGMTDLLFDYWLILFTTACFANMLGLNISASFNSAVTIYIIIPFLIIPQILFSGAIVKFEKLNPTVTSQKNVPFVGEVMASRWSFEALAVNQYVTNKYERLFYPYDKEMSVANFNKNFWIPALKGKMGSVETHIQSDKPEDREKLAADLELLKNEIKAQQLKTPFITYDFVDDLTLEKLDADKFSELKDYLAELNSHYIKQYNFNSDKKDEIIREFQATEESKLEFNTLRNDYENESLSDLATNKNEFNQISEYDGRLIQRADPVFLTPDSWRSHFYAPVKNFFGTKISTFWFNIIVLWSMCVLMAVMLYYDALLGLLNSFEIISSKFKKKD